MTFLNFLNYILKSSQTENPTIFHQATAKNNSPNMIQRIFLTEARGTKNTGIPTIMRRN